MGMHKQQILLWDLPTRLFHWLLVLSVTAAIVSGELGGNLMVWHGRIGVFIAGLLAFRLVWGMLGSTYARFAQFFPTPDKVLAYVKGRWRGLGHNPLGACSVFALLGFLAFQVATGLFANDDIAFQGPLFSLVEQDLSKRLSGWHHEAAEFLLALIGLHLAAIAFYGHVHKENLVQPMVTGWKEVEQGVSARGGGVVALIVALAIALAAAYGASGAWLPELPPPPPAAETPAW